MLEGAAQPERCGALRRLRAQRVALELDSAGAERQHAGDQIEGRALAGAVGADQADDAAAFDLETDIVDRDQPAECFSRRAAPAAAVFPARAAVASGSRWSSRGFGGVGAGGGPNRIGHRPLEAVCRISTSTAPKAMASKLPVLPISQGKKFCNWSRRNGDAGRAENGAVDPAGAAEHRHQQIFGAGADAERTGRYRALEMRVEPSGEAGQHRGIDEHHQLGGGGVDAEGFGGAGAAPKRADGAADPAAEQVLRGDHRKHDRDPDHHEIFARIDQRMVADPQRRNAGKPVMGAEPVDDCRTDRRTRCPRRWCRAADSDRKAAP